MGNKVYSNNSQVQTELTEENIQFLLNNTSFDREQIHDWHRGFLKESPSGLMNFNEFVNFYSAMFPSGNAERFCKRVFKVFDTNKSNSIDFNELLLAISITSLGSLDKKLTLAFEIYDLDKNGKIDAHEMTTIIEAIYDLIDYDGRLRVGTNSPEERVKSIIEQLDKNNDKSLSRDEFIIGLTNDQVIRSLLVPYA